MSEQKTFDLVLFGATSFVGKIASRYLLEHVPQGAPVRWALAARSQSKLDDLLAELGDSDIPTVIAQADNPQSLIELCGSTRLVISTVGPYALYGSKLVAECARSGTDYCDLTGEVQWIRQMIEQHHETARANGARIVHCCGFDSIPSDLGVHFTQSLAEQRFGQRCDRISMRVKAMKGGFSGGTVASLINVMKEAAADKALRKELADPYSICPEGYGEGVKQPSKLGASKDAVSGQWTAPFIMAAINTRVVQRSAALQGLPVLSYEEAMLCGKGLKGRAAAYGLVSALGTLGAASAFRLSRALVERLLPSPGEGPSEEEQLAGYYDLRFFGQTADGQTVESRVTGDRDPGYGSTAKMLVESALCLLQDVPDAEGGVLTPASVMAEPLIKRLQANAGLAFEALS